MTNLYLVQNAANSSLEDIEARSWELSREVREGQARRAARAQQRQEEETSPWEIALVAVSLAAIFLTI